MWPSNYEELIAFPSHCTKNQSEIHSRENKSEHISVNIDKNNVRQIKIDGDILPSNYNEERRADYLVLNETKNTAYLIELKGSHVMSAFQQVEHTDRKLSDALKNIKVYWRVICSSRTTGLHTDTVKKYQKAHPQLLLKKGVHRENI